MPVLSGNYETYELNCMACVHTLRIGPYLIDPAIILAPMAGVTDRPFRQLCKQLGAGLAVSEMVAFIVRLVVSLGYCDYSNVDRKKAQVIAFIYCPRCNRVEVIARGARWHCTDCGHTWRRPKTGLHRSAPQVESGGAN